MTGTQLELFPLSALDTDLWAGQIGSDDMPAYIGSDDYAGRFTTHFSPKRHRVAVYTARELVSYGRSGAFFESYGRVSDRHEGFSRTRYVADRDGNLHCYDPNGAKVIVHPADRKLRVLTGK